MVSCQKPGRTSGCQPVTHASLKRPRLGYRWPAKGTALITPPRLSGGPIGAVEACHHDTATRFHAGYRDRRRRAVDEEHPATSTPAGATAGAKFRQVMRTTVFEPTGITWRFKQPLDC